MAANMICIVLALVVSGPDAVIALFKYGVWILFPFMLPISAKYLK